jgi:hypothetical protein
VDASQVLYNFVGSNGKTNMEFKYMGSLFHPSSNRVDYADLNKGLDKYLENI